MRNSNLNLASRPFANQAPVLRVGILLAVMALALLFINVSRYRSYFSGAGEDARQQLLEIDRRLGQLDEELSNLQGELAQRDLAALNAQIEFLNLRIRERVFGWSRLFQDLESVVPHDVRLQRLSPQHAGTGDKTWVVLSIQGTAATEDGLLRFIDALFEAQRFKEPNPVRQSQRGGQYDFTLTAIYVPPVRARGRRDQGSAGGAGS